jgi:XTP/dITP diphosphohydrolase
MRRSARALASTDAGGVPARIREVVLATRSAGKVRELRALFLEAGIEATDLVTAGVPEDPREGSIERFTTFGQNARAKAEWFAARLPGRVVLAEDSGLEVMALGGAPGVQSKRWAGHTAALSGAALDAANNDALIRAMRGVRDRRARYACVAVLMRDTRVIAVAHGECTGHILESPRGASGFGYDPWFESDELGRTFAESTIEEKARASHRARAVREILARMRGAGFEGS